jgi:hypothetical protein
MSVLALVGCTVHHDTTPQTTAGRSMGELSLDQSVQSYEEGKVQVFATPYTTSSSLLVLDAGDRFETTIGGAFATPLAKDGNHYTATVTTPNPGPFDVTISLVRTNPSGEAKSTVTLPVPPHVLNPPATLTQGQDLLLDLADAPPKGANVRLRILDTQVFFGDVVPTCLQLSDPIVSPSNVSGTRITVSSAVLFARDPAKKDPQSKTCDVRIGVRFETNGKRDPALGGGGISGLMERPAYATGGLHVTRTDM